MLRITFNKSRFYEPYRVVTNEPNGLKSEDLNGKNLISLPSLRPVLFRGGEKVKPITIKMASGPTYEKRFQLYYVGRQLVMDRKSYQECCTSCVTTEDFQRLQHLGILMENFHTDPDNAFVEQWPQVRHGVLDYRADDPFEASELDRRAEKREAKAQKRYNALLKENNN